MQDIHPTSTAGDGKRLKNRLHRAPDEPSESIFIRCPHCGIPNDSTIESQPPSYPIDDNDGGGLTYVTTSISIPGGTRTFVEAQRVNGCRLCGHNFETSSYRRKFFSTVDIQGR